ncbi:hypothetical protein ACIP9X_14430 [Arthrobacter sp. NPDC093125]|uniref:hypothetical protein n=1 Tax=Arthrobacter sp. NPDC093125 TaxID=3363944 RepID=UPI00382B199A
MILNSPGWADLTELWSRAAALIGRVGARLKRSDGVAQGSGDGVVYIEAKTDKAAITNTGAGNFVVCGYGGSRAELAVNEGQRG